MSETKSKGASKKTGTKDASAIRQGAKKAGIQKMLEKKRKGFSGAKSQLYK
jgi:hypothetical protein